MDYIYYLGKASLVIHLIHHLQEGRDCPIHFMTVLHQLSGWIVRVKPQGWSVNKQANFKAFLNELGAPHTPDRRVNKVLHALEHGDLPIDVMRRYQVAVIVHGVPNIEEIEVFRQQFIEGLGYCPETLA